MTEIEEFKKINDAQHKALSTKIDNIGATNKILLSIIAVIFAVMLTVLLSINRYSEKAYNVRVETLKIVDKVNMYDKEINKNTKDIKSNSLRIGKVEKKVGLY